MTDAEFERIMEQKRVEAAKPGYGARCAAKATKVRRSSNQDQSRRELVLS